MTVTVLDSSDLVESVLTGKVPVPPGIAEDNKAQAAKKAAAAEATDAPRETKGTAPEKPTEKAQAPPPDEDDIEGEDGITPRQKREFTKSMLSTIAKKHRAQREAEELATSEYNRGRMAEERAERLAAENAALKAQLQPKETVPESKAPVRADFQSDAEYADALIDYRVDQKLAAKQAEDAKRAEAERQAQVLAQAGARLDAARELVPDFDEVTGAIALPVPPAIATHMQESDLFAELGYHFAKHPHLLEQLNAYTAGLKPGTDAFVKGTIRSLVELGKIESMLSPFASGSTAAKVENGEKPSRSNGQAPSEETGSSPSKPRVSAPVISPLNVSSSAQVGKPEEQMRSSEVITAWQRKNGVKLTARKRH